MFFCSERPPFSCQYFSLGPRFYSFRLVFLHFPTVRCFSVVFRLFHVPYFSFIFFYVLSFSIGFPILLSMSLVFHCFPVFSCGFPLAFMHLLRCSFMFLTFPWAFFHFLSVALLFLRLIGFLIVVVFHWSSFIAFSCPFISLILFPSLPLLTFTCFLSVSLHFS